MRLRAILPPRLRFPSRLLPSDLSREADHVVVSTPAPDRPHRAVH